MSEGNSHGKPSTSQQTSLYLKVIVNNADIQTEVFESLEASVSVPLGHSVDADSILWIFQSNSGLLGQISSLSQSTGTSSSLLSSINAEQVEEDYEDDQFDDVNVEEFQESPSQVSHPHSSTS